MRNVLFLQQYHPLDDHNNDTQNTQLEFLQENDGNEKVKGIQALDLIQAEKQRIKELKKI